MAAPVLQLRPSPTSVKATTGRSAAAQSAAAQSSTAERHSRGLPRVPAPASVGLHSEDQGLSPPQEDLHDVAHGLTAAMSLSVLLALSAAVLLGQNGGPGSQSFRLGALCVLAVLALQVEARRSARRKLERAWRAQGLDRTDAARQAGKWLGRWLG